MSTSRVPEPENEASLAAQVRQLTRQVNGLTKDLDEATKIAAAASTSAESAARAAAKLTEAVESLSGRPGQSGAPLGGPLPEEPAYPGWLDIDDAETAQARLTDLAGWVQNVLLHWPVQDAPFPSCWAWHPWMIAELFGLRDAWDEAHDPERGSPRARMDWIDRYRPGVIRRLTEKRCNLSRHTDPGRWPTPITPGVGLLPELATWWATARGQEPAPVPTPKMIEDDHTRHL